MDSTLPDTRQHDHELTVADLKFNRPELSEQSLVELAGDCFGVSGTLQALAGERDQNSRITTSDGSQFVLKISGAGEDPQTVDFQVKALQHIEQKDPGIPVPRVVAGKDGAMVQKIRRADGEHMVRLLTWLPGIPYEAGPTPSLAALHQVGVFIARLNQALEGFSHAAAAQFMPWDICNGLIFNQQLQGLLPVQTRELIGPALNRLECDVYPQLPGLRAQVIHQDGHGGNLLRRAQDSEEVSGVIDFGDMIHGPLISDLAVCASHFIENHMYDASRITSAICAGFATLIPLEQAETDILLDLIIARQILTLQLFEFRRRYVKNSPAFVTDDQPGILASLTRLVTLDPVEFADKLRQGHHSSETKS